MALEHEPQVHGMFPPPSAITAVVLAAGRSSRMGAVKAVLPLRAPWGEPEGELVCERVLRLCEEAGLGRRVVVLGEHEEVVRPKVSRRADLARNPAPQRGMVSSVQVGFRVALGVPSPPSAVLLWPVDVPLVQASTLKMLLGSGLEALARPEDLWVRAPSTGLGEGGGHPLLVSRGVAREVLRMPSDGRLDALLKEPRVAWQRVLVEDRMVRLDLDTWVQARPYVVKGAWSEEGGG